jgi:hypothetical protein
VGYLIDAGLFSFSCTAVSPSCSATTGFSEILLVFAVSYRQQRIRTTRPEQPACQMARLLPGWVANSSANDRRQARLQHGTQRQMHPVIDAQSKTRLSSRRKSAIAFSQISRQVQPPGCFQWREKIIIKFLKRFNWSGRVSRGSPAYLKNNDYTFI